jgi:hypothetical protein
MNYALNVFLDIKNCKRGRRQRLKVFNAVEDSATNCKRCQPLANFLALSATAIKNFSDVADIAKTKLPLQKLCSV